MRGARLLAGLRAAALLLILALLLDPPVPFGGWGAPTRWVLLDASLSMEAVPTAGGESAPAVRARARAAELEARGWTVVPFGEGLAGTARGAGGVDGPDDTDAAAVSPGARATPAPEARTLLAPALARAAEAGAREVRVLSDLRFEDVVAAEAAIRSLPLEARFEEFGGTIRNAGILELDVPDRPRADEPVSAELDLHGGVHGDTLVVEVLEEERPVARVRVAAPGAGFRRATSVELPPAEVAGLVRYTARIHLDDDGFPHDDEAVAYARVGLEDEAALVVVSLHPTWEPRSVLPALEAVTGLAGSGYLRVGPDRFAPIGLALERGAPVDSAAVRLAAGEATVLVVHGLDAETDAWGRALAGVGARRIVFLTDPGGAEVLGLPALPPLRGEWYVRTEIPASPVAGLLAGSIHDRLPPLQGLLHITPAEGLEAPLEARLDGTGTVRPPVLLRTEPSRRTVLVLASGFWRWAARPDGREAYRALWSAAAGWLLREQTVAGEEIRPGRWVFARDEAVTWRVPPDRTGFRVTVRSGDEVVLDTAFDASGVRASGRLAPGTYRYVVTSPARDSVAGGRFDVAATTPELVPAPADPGRFARAELGGAGSGTAPMRPPLRTSPWPYLLIIVLLCAEWIGRRRRGLR